MQRWWVLYLDISLLLYLHVSTSFLGTLSFGPSGLLKAFRGMFTLQAPWTVGFFGFNTWALINILGQDWWEDGPFHLLDSDPHGTILWLNLTPPTIAPQNFALFATWESGVLVKGRKFDTFWMHSHVGVSFHLSHTRSWCFSIHNATVNVASTCMSPTFYGAMKIQQLKFFWINRQENYRSFVTPI